MSERLKAAERLAEIHYQSESTSDVYVVAASVDAGNPADESIKLVEVDEDTIPVGIVPLRFGPLPERGIDFNCDVVEVTSEEYAQIQTGELSLPEGWGGLSHLKRPSEAVSTDE